MTLIITAGETEGLCYSMKICKKSPVVPWSEILVWPACWIQADKARQECVNKSLNVGGKKRSIMLYLVIKPDSDMVSWQDVHWGSPPKNNHRFEEMEIKQLQARASTYIYSSMYTYTYVALVNGVWGLGRIDAVACIRRRRCVIQILEQPALRKRDRLLHWSRKFVAQISHSNGCTATFGLASWCTPSSAAELQSKVSDCNRFNRPLYSLWQSRVINKWCWATHRPSWDVWCFPPPSPWHKRACCCIIDDRRVSAGGGGEGGGRPAEAEACV